MIQKMSNAFTLLEKAQLESPYLIRYFAVRASAVQISAFDVSATLREKLLLQLLLQLHAAHQLQQSSSFKV
jgi:hypothetical protein